MQKKQFVTVSVFVIEDNV